MKKALLAMATAVALSGCYHATFETGLPPSPQMLENKWANSWIYGLVPPETVETMAECSNGVARVETQLSFLNQLVALLTFGIYTPMELSVTCASSGMQDAALIDNPHDFTEALMAGAPFWVSLH